MTYDEVVHGEVARLRETLERGSEWTKPTAKVAFGWDERHFRRVVSELRETGYPVIATSEAGSTYRKAKTREELVAFVERELISRTLDMERQIRVLLDGADIYFGGDQLRIAI